jgi:fructokinase
MEDFNYLFGLQDADAIYERVRSLCSTLIITDGARSIRVFTPEGCETYPVAQIDTVSTVGAGDNFNAGILYGLVRDNIDRAGLETITQDQWSRLIGYGIEFGSEACMSTSNYVSTEFANKYKTDR